MKNFHENFFTPDQHGPRHGLSVPHAARGALSLPGCRRPFGHRCAPGGGSLLGCAHVSPRATPRARAGRGCGVRRPTPRESASDESARIRTYPCRPGALLSPLSSDALRRHPPWRGARAAVARGAGDRVPRRASGAGDWSSGGARARWRAIRFPMRPYPVAGSGSAGAPRRARPSRLGLMLLGRGKERRPARCADEAPLPWWPPRRYPIRFPRPPFLPRCPAATGGAQPRRVEWLSYSRTGPVGAPARDADVVPVGFVVLSVAPAAASAPISSDRFCSRPSDHARCDASG